MISFPLCQFFKASHIKNDDMAFHPNTVFRKGTQHVTYRNMFRLIRLHLD